MAVQQHHDSDKETKGEGEVSIGFVWFVEGMRTGEFLLVVDKSLLLFWVENTIFILLLIFLHLRVGIGSLVPRWAKTG